MVLDLQTQLSRVQEWIPEVVPGAEHQDVSSTHRAILEQVVFVLTVLNFICSKQVGLTDSVGHSVSNVLQVINYLRQL